MCKRAKAIIRLSLVLLDENVYIGFDIELLTVRRYLAASRTVLGKVGNSTSAVVALNHLSSQQHNAYNTDCHYDPGHEQPDNKPCEFLLLAGEQLAILIPALNLFAV